MICLSMHIPASTELTEFLYISCGKKLPHPFADALGHMPPAPYSLLLTVEFCPIEILFRWDHVCCCFLVRGRVMSV